LPLASLTTLTRLGLLRQSHPPSHRRHHPRVKSALHCIALHCTALHCIALHCIALLFVLPSPSEPSEHSCDCSRCDLAAAAASGERWLRYSERPSLHSLIHILMLILILKTLETRCSIGPRPRLRGRRRRRLQLVCYVLLLVVFLLLVLGT
jgi:hypothetical protein